MSANLAWYISRTAALAAYGVFFASVVLGLGARLKFLDRVCAKWQSSDLHQFTALLGMALVCLHVFSLLADTYYGYGFQQLLVPLQSPYRPEWTAWGIIGLYVSIVVMVSSYLRRFIGQRAWRAVHFASFGLFWIIFIHGVRAGTDIALPWVRVMYIASGVIVAFLFLLRIADGLFRAAPRTGSPAGLAPHFPPQPALPSRRPQAR